MKRESALGQNNRNPLVPCPALAIAKVAISIFYGFSGRNFMIPIQITDVMKRFRTENCNKLVKLPLIFILNQIHSLFVYQGLSSLPYCSVNLTENSGCFIVLLVTLGHNPQNISYIPSTRSCLTPTSYVQVTIRSDGTKFKKLQRKYGNVRNLLGTTE